MRIVLVTSGSLGDVRPMLALAVGLQRNGHDILLCGPPESEPLARRHQCAFQALGDNVEAFARSVPDPALNRIKAGSAFGRFIRQQAIHQCRVLPDLAQGASLILGASLVYGVPSAAEALGIPYRFVMFCPQLLPSAAHPSPMGVNHRLPGWVNRLSWRCFTAFTNLNLRSSINRERKRLGLDPINDVWRNLLGADVLLASDPELADVPADVQYPCTHIGHMALRDDTPLSAELEAFLNAGPPPVYIGFGSMPSDDPERISRIVLDAARQTGCRLVLSRGWAGLDAGNSDWLFTVGEVSHARLFPRVAATVQHGGAGTTAAAARGGAPQVIIPHTLDQHYWANRITQLGIGPRPIRKEKLTATRLAEAIKVCLNNQDMRQRAARLGERLSRRNGVEEAVKTITKLATEC